MAKCSIPHCSARAGARGLCDPHYGRWRRGAPYPAPLTRVPHGKYTTCTVEGCGEDHCGKGLCRKHYQRQWAGKSLEDPPELVGEAHPRATLTAELVREIQALRSAGLGGTQISRQLQVSRNAVQGVISGRTWRHI